MKSCPGCLFLIDDDQELCDTCFTQQNTSIQPIQIGAGAGGTALLERNGMAAAAVDTVNVRYRSSRPVASLRGVLATVLLLCGAVALASAAGYGPLAPKFSAWHLTFNRSEVFPQNWEHLDDLSDVFVVDLPAGSKTIFEPLDSANPGKGGIVGKSVDTVDGANMAVAWTDFGRGVEGLRALDSPEGLSNLLKEYAAIRVDGEMTVARPLVLPFGRAVDAVFVDQAKGPKTGTGSGAEYRTTRVRMLLAPKHVFILQTSGPDSDSEALDSAHQRLLKSFRPSF